MSARSAWKLLLVLLLVVLYVSAFAAEPKPDAAKKLPKAKSTAKPRVLVTLSKETTYITEPLRADGYPDYVAALNQRMSKGVTPENNAAVLFWKALGPSEMPKDYRERFFQLLGIPPLPEKGDYFVTSSAQISRHESKHEDAMLPSGDPEEPAKTPQGQMTLAMKRPWSKQEFPVWAEWLETNEKPLVLVVEACRRPHRYEPLVSGPDNTGMLIAALLPGTQDSRECARTLVMRAMLRLGEGKVDDAWSDLLDCHRLARLTDEGSTLVDGLVAITIEAIAEKGDHAVLQYAKLTAAQIAKMRDDLDKLPRLSKMVDRLDTAERFMLLDCMSAMAREGPNGIRGLLGDGTPKKDDILDSLMNSLAKSSIDWDIILRMGNSWYDRLVAAGRHPTRAERRKACSKLDKDLKEMAASAKDPTSIALSLLGNPRTAISERIGQIFVALLLPATQAAQEAEDRITMQCDLNKLAFALAAYRADEGSYPAKLADLVPKYVKEVPKDMFNNDADLHYTQQGGGYLLYSVGSNGKDDGGKNWDDRKNNEDWDDLTVRMSPTEH
jgi:hypothetical protein